MTDYHLTPEQESTLPYKSAFVCACCGESHPGAQRAIRAVLGCVNTLRHQRDESSEMHGAINARDFIS
jgi:hypothetical protein